MNRIFHASVGENSEPVLCSLVWLEVCVWLIHHTTRSDINTSVKHANANRRTAILLGDDEGGDDDCRSLLLLTHTGSARLCFERLRL